MTWFTNLFKKKKIEKTIYNDDLEWDIFINFSRGKKYLLEEKWKDALYHLDKALELGYEKDDIYEMRGYCLQELKYHFDAIEDFNKAILFSPDNCHLYFNRALSKEAVFDYHGEIEDIEKAIELSKKDTSLNKQYNKDAINNGYPNGLIGMYEIALLSAKSRLEFESYEREKHNEEKIKHIKRR